MHLVLTHMRRYLWTFETEWWGYGWARVAGFTEPGVCNILGNDQVYFGLDRSWFWSVFKGSQCWFQLACTHSACTRLKKSLSRQGWRSGTYEVYNSDFLVKVFLSGWIDFLSYYISSICSELFVWNCSLYAPSRTLKSYSLHIKFPTKNFRNLSNYSRWAVVMTGKFEHCWLVS